VRRLSFGQPANQNDFGWCVRALKKIEQASVEDIEQVFDDYTVTGTFTETRTLDVATATLPDLIAFIATLVTDIQKRGQNRTGE
jgi:hypothetical protein